MKTIILKNTTGSELYVLLRQIPATDQDDFSNESEEDLRNANGLLTLISTGDIVVNDGTSDLDSEVGQSYISGGDLIRDEGSTITLNATALDFVGGGVVASNAGDGVITISIPGGAGVSNAITTVVGDTGSFTGVGEDTLNILGGLGIDTIISGDVLTIILNAALDDLSDVDVPAPAAASQLVFDSGSGNWEAQSPSASTPFGQMFEIVFSNGSTVADSWIDSNGTPSNEAPPVCGWECRLAGITFTNNRDTVSTNIEIYRTAEGALPTTRTLVATWSISNARTARKTDYTNSDGGNFVQFFEGDKISVYFQNPGGVTNPRGITLILHFIITDFTSAEVVDNWSGDISDP